MTKPLQKPTHRNAVHEKLCAEFPVFRDYQPLAIGVHKTIMERIPEFDKAQVRNALRGHTGSTRYLKSLVEGAKRFDLDGNSDGLVTKEQQEQAAGTLRERFKKAAEKRLAEREAQQHQGKLLRLAEKFNVAG